jgi:hypothetical protein
MKKEEDRMQRVGKEIEDEILRAIRKIQFGSVEIVIHDSRIVQFEVREKVRLEKPSLNS